MRAKIRVIPNGVDVEKFKPMKRGLAVEWFESRYGKLHPELNVVYLGRLSPEKGVVYLIHAMKFVDGILFIAGSGPQERELVQIAKKYDGKVKFLGKIKHEDVPYVYNAMDVFVLPSVSMEGFSNSMLEAMACGLPVVATPVGAAPEVVRPEIGVIVEVRDPAALAEGIEKVRNLSRRKIHLLTKREYSFGVVARIVFNFYTSVVGSEPERVCFASLFSPPYDLSGAGIQVYDLSKALSEFCEVTILCGIGGGEKEVVEFKNVKIVNTHLLSRPTYALTASLSVLNENEFDVVDGRNWEGGIVAWMAKKSGSKGVMSLRGEGAVGKAMWKKTINRFLIQRLDYVTATDSRTARLAEMLIKS